MSTSDPRGAVLTATAAPAWAFSDATAIRRRGARGRVGRGTGPRCVCVCGELSVGLAGEKRNVTSFFLAWARSDVREWVLLYASTACGKRLVYH